jgi:hypothetical protein
MLFFYTGCDQVVTPDAMAPTVEVPAEEKTAEVPEKTPEIKQKTYYIKTSAWTDYVVPSSGRAVTDGELPLNEAMKIVESYNATHNDDQLFLTLEDTPVEEAPDCRVRIVDIDTYAPKLYPGSNRAYDLIVPRAEVMNNKEIWARECFCIGNGLLFVDKDPPAEIPPKVDTTDPNIKYRVYIIRESDGAIMYYLNCYQTYDMEAMGYKTLDIYFTAMKTCYESEARAMGSGYYVKSGCIYIPPVIPEPTE